MKYFLLLSLLLISASLHALPCPNGRGILYKGDTVSEVLKQCGEPLEKRTTTRTIYTAEQWVYYRGHVFDRGFSQLIVSFKNDRVVSIYINDRYWLPVCRQAYIQLGNRLSTLQTSCGNWAYYTVNTNLCGGIFGIGDSTQRVAAVCGLPAERSPLETYTVEVTEFTYSGHDPQVIVFQDGRLIEWR
ncbi:DUF2845 domain-containing protein [Aquicella lusitana]|uniref:Uncharacterized protein DUF2845 n=1 Tax=Aquicella lusitana TaxID=254246 RepID=A0A370GWP6_9COXI|nr:DUF2845 domain-containing protein [Aquicella lusitana]RDI48072.1 uncharacterized protein DUF2845 [Aquicella lusitana]VVC72912.1 hypothetical protein AQULUS_06360 [Aquicella lusitana]